MSEQRAKKSDKAEKTDGSDLSMVAVLWMDAVGSPERHFPPHPIISVGFPVLNNKEYIVIASERHADGSYRDFTTLPKSMIREAFKLKPLKLPAYFTNHMEEIDSDG